MWLRIIEACRTARLSPTVLYRRAVIGEVQTRRGDGGRLEFLVADLRRLAQKGGAKATSAN